MEIDKLWFSITAVEELTGNSEWNYSPEGDDVNNELFDITAINYPPGYVGERPTLEQVESRMNVLISTHRSMEYARLRKAEYDELNQFELISDDAINGTSTYKDAILAIKAKYPKGI